MLTPAGRLSSTEEIGRASGYRSQYSCLEDRRVSLNTYAREKRNLRIRFVHWSFCRICRVLPDAACRRFHATRPRPQLRKPAWLPFYTGGDASLQLVLSAFIFRLPCGQQRSITPPANPTDLRRPCGTTDALIVPKHSGIKPLSDSTADASLRFLIASQASTVSRRHNPTRRARPVVS